MGPNMAPRDEWKLGVKGLSNRKRGTSEREKWAEYVALAALARAMNHNIARGPRSGVVVWGGQITLPRGRRMYRYIRAGFPGSPTVARARDSARDARRRLRLY